MVFQQIAKSVAYFAEKCVPQCSRWCRTVARKSRSAIDTETVAHESEVEWMLVFVGGGIQASSSLPLGQCTSAITD